MKKISVTLVLIGFVSIAAFFALASFNTIEYSVYAEARSVASDLASVENELSESISFWRNVMQQSSIRKDSVRDEKISLKMVNSLTGLKNEVMVARNRLENVTNMDDFTGPEVRKAISMAKETRDNVFHKLTRAPIIIYDAFSPAPEKFFKPR